MTTDTTIRRVLLGYRVDDEMREDNGRIERQSTRFADGEGHTGDVVTDGVQLGVRYDDGVIDWLADVQAPQLGFGEGTIVLRVLED